MASLFSRRRRPSIQIIARPNRRSGRANLRSLPRARPPDPKGQTRARPINSAAAAAAALICIANPSRAGPAIAQQWPKFIRRTGARAAQPKGRPLRVANWSRPGGGRFWGLKSGVLVLVRAPGQPGRVSGGGGNCARAGAFAQHLAAQPPPPLLGHTRSGRSIVKSLGRRSIAPGSNLAADQQYGPAELWRQRPASPLFCRRRRRSFGHSECWEVAKCVH